MGFRFFPIPIAIAQIHTCRIEMALNPGKTRVSGLFRSHGPRQDRQDTGDEGARATRAGLVFLLLLLLLWLLPIGCLHAHVGRHMCS